MPYLYRSPIVLSLLLLVTVCAFLVTPSSSFLLVNGHVGLGFSSRSPFQNECSESSADDANKLAFELVAARPVLSRTTAATAAETPASRLLLLEAHLHAVHMEAIRNRAEHAADDARAKPEPEPALEMNPKKAMHDGDLMPEYKAAEDALDAFLETFMMDEDAFNACYVTDECVLPLDSIGLQVAHA